MDLKKLLEKKSELFLSCKEILQKAEQSAEGLLSEEEKTDFENKKQQLAEIKEQISLIQGFQQQEEDEKNESAPVIAADKIERKVMKNAPEAKKEFESLDDWMLTVLTNPNDQRLEYQEYKSEQRMDTGSAGGFAVPKQFVAEVRAFEASPALVRSRATVIPAGFPPDAEISLPVLNQEPDSEGNARVHGGVEVFKVQGEGTAKKDTEYLLREVSLKPYEVAAIIPLTDKLLRNWTAASNWAVTLLRNAIASFEDNEFLKGNGVGGPAGCLDADACYVVNRTLAAQVTLADIQEMYARFRGDEAGGFWPISRGAFSQLLSMIGDGGGATNVINIDRSTGGVTLYGMPVIRSGRMRALGQRGDVALLDLADYLIKDGSGPIVEVGFDDGQWRKNMRSIKITWNVDGRSLYSKPFVDEEGYEVSSFVVLDVPSGS